MGLFWPFSHFFQYTHFYIERLPTLSDQKVVRHILTEAGRRAAPLEVARIRQVWHPAGHSRRAAPLEVARIAQVWHPAGHSRRAATLEVARIRQVWLRDVVCYNVAQL
jgi:hypothetical protein